MIRSTRVALHDSHGVSIIPLTKASLEPRIIFLRASTEPQATNPSRRWQPPRVTSTIGLQLEHLVPLDATSRCNCTRITLSLDPINNTKHEWVRRLPSTTTQATNEYGSATGQGQGRSPLLFIAPRMNMAITPSLDEFRDNRTHCTASGYSQSSMCPSGFNRDCSISIVNSMLQRSDATGRASDTDRTHGSHTTACAKHDRTHRSRDWPDALVKPSHAPSTKTEHASPSYRTL
jgi:hypothetical protein